MSATEPISVVVVDDELPARELMRRLVGGRKDLHLAGEAANGLLAVEIIRGLAPDLVLLDIEMPGLDGFGVVAELHADRSPLPRFIFVTAYDRYAVRAFDVNAVDYLLKPVTPERFDQAIDRYRETRASRHLAPLRTLLEDALRLPPERLLVRDRGRILPVPVASIDWIEAEGDYARLHTTAKGYLIEKSLEELEVLLAARGFARVHRSAIVNVDRIDEIHAEGSGRYRLQLRGGVQLIASRSYSARFRSGVL